MSLTLGIPCHPGYKIFLPSLLINLGDNKPDYIVIALSETSDIHCQIIEHYLRKLVDSELKVLGTLEIRSPGSNRNRCIEYCETDYICFMDADDLMMGGAINKMRSLINSGGECFVGQRFENDYVTKNNLLWNAILISKTVKTRFDEEFRYGEDKRFGLKVSEDYVLCKVVYVFVKFIKHGQRYNHDIKIGDKFVSVW